MLVPLLLLAVIACLWLSVWGPSLAGRCSMLSLVLTVVVVGYVFGYELWHLHAGPLPLTLDRLLLLAVAGLLGWRLLRGQVHKTPLVLTDWLLGLTVAWLTLSCLLHRPGDATTLPDSPMFRLLVSFWIPAFLYGILRFERIDGAKARRVLVVFASLGVYLGVTALLETAGVGSLIFPRYIADPELGTHFGRARGPALNSVSLGTYLSVTAAAAWLLIPRASRRMKLFWLGGAGLMALGVLLTYTRSTWIGLAGAVVMVLCLQLPRRLRTPAFVLAGVLGVAFLAVGKDALSHLKREDSGEVSAHSVQQRTAFAYVSLRMFQDHPLVGVGFGRFFDQKLPYLTDRRQSFELESLRNLHHHNTFLSLLTETGLLGLAAYAGILAGLGLGGWRLAHCEHVDPDCRRLGLLMIGTLAIYLPSALFHDLTLLHSDQWLLFTVGGATIGCLVNRPTGAAIAQPIRFPISLPSFPATLTPQSLMPTPVNATNAKRIQLFGMTIDRLKIDEAADRLLDWSTDSESNERCRYVVTPNVDHAVMHQEQPELRAAYDKAAMIVADGAPLIAASRLLGKGLPERVAGSDLAPRLLEMASAQFTPGREPLRVFLLGAGPGVADRAAEKIHLRWPGVEVVGTHCPPLGFEQDKAENERILTAISAAKPDVLLVGLGAPKQELWVHRYHQRIDARVALCIGATIDFLAGEKKRSPVWLQRIGMEWAHRLLSEPRRLASRYARDAWIFPQLVLAEWFASRHTAS